MNFDQIGFRMPVKLAKISHCKPDILAEKPCHFGFDRGKIYIGKGAAYRASKNVEPMPRCAGFCDVMNIGRHRASICR